MTTLNLLGAIGDWINIWQLLGLVILAGLIVTWVMIKKKQ